MLRLRFRCVVDTVHPRGNGGFELVIFKILSEYPIPPLPSSSLLLVVDVIESRFIVFIVADVSI